MFPGISMSNALLILAYSWVTLRTDKPRGPALAALSRSLRTPSRACAWANKGVLTLTTLVVVRKLTGSMKHELDQDRRILLATSFQY